MYFLFSSAFASIEKRNPGRLGKKETYSIFSPCCTHAVATVAGSIHLMDVAETGPLGCNVRCCLSGPIWYKQGITASFSPTVSLHCPH